MARGPLTDDACLTDPGAVGRAARRRPSLPLGLLGAALLAAAGLAGCGSRAVADLPPAAGPDRSPPLTTPAAGEPASRSAAMPASGTETTLRDGTLRAVLRPRERVFTILGADGRERSRQPAGVGPTQVACVPEGPCFVVDTQGDAVLVFRVGEGGRSLRLSRRVYVAGAPYAIALDPERRRLWITLTARNEVVELGAHGRPHILQRLPTIRQPDRIAVDPNTGDVTVAGRSGDAVTLADPMSPDR